MSPVRSRSPAPNAHSALTSRRSDLSTIPEPPIWPLAALAAGFIVAFAKKVFTADTLTHRVPDRQRQLQDHRRTLARPFTCGAHVPAMLAHDCPHEEQSEPSS